MPGWLWRSVADEEALKELTENEQVKKMVDDAVEKLNAGLASYETVKKYAILPVWPKFSTG